MVELKNKQDFMEYPYKTMEQIITINDFDLIEMIDPRQVRSTQVNSIYRGLNNNQHFDSVFVVNVDNGRKKIRIIDGNHRLLAIRRWLEKNPEKQIKVLMAAYQDLTPEQERQIYTKWNIGVKQTIDDFLNSYKSEIKVLRNLLDDNRVSIYGSKKSIKVRILVDAYLSSKNCPFTGGMSYSRQQWLNSFRKLNMTDVGYMMDTFNLLCEVYNPTKITDFMRLPAFKTSVFRALFYLAGFNKVVLGRKYVKRRMTTVLYNKAILETYKHGTRYASMDAYMVFKQLLNRNAKKKFR